MTQQRRSLFSLGAGLAVLSLFMTMGNANADNGKGGGGNNNGDDVRQRTQMAGAAIGNETPSGHADFRARASRNRTSLNVEVQDVALADGTTLSVSIVHAGATTMVGSLKLKLGRGELELNSQDGDTVPAIATGDMVIVSSSGTAILTGVF